MSKQTQISLDFGPEEQTPPAPTGDNGAGNDPPRHYMAAGGVGVRVKSYKQTPAPGGGDLFGDAVAPKAAAMPGTNGLSEPPVEGPLAEIAAREADPAAGVPTAAGLGTDGLGATEPIATGATDTGANDTGATDIRATDAAEAVGTSHAKAPVAVLQEAPAAVLPEIPAGASPEVAVPVPIANAAPVAALPEAQTEASSEVALPEAQAEASSEVALPEPPVNASELALAEPPAETSSEVTLPALPANASPEDALLPRRQVSAKATAARQKTPPPQAPSKRGRKSLKQVSAEADLIEIPVDEVLFSKQYYTMGEVSEMFRVNQSLLRFWESEFDILQPRKNKKGDRYFRPVDIKNLHLIYHLLRQKKYTIEGAKEFLKKNKKADERFEVVQRLQEIKAFLLEWKAQL